jgi:hypothetical protein
MGNEQKGSVNLKSKNNSWIKFDEDDKKDLMKFYNFFYNKEKKIFNYNKFIENTFLILHQKIKTNLINFLQSFYNLKQIKKNINNNNFDLQDFFSIAYLITKINTDSNEENYFKKNTFFILYDIYKGKVNLHKENYDINDLINIFNFITLLYFNKYSNKNKNLSFSEDKFDDDYNKEFKIFLLENLKNSDDLNESFENNEINYNLIENFVSEKLYNLDSFLKHYFNGIFFNKLNDEYYENLSPFPIFNSPPSTISIYEFFYYCLSNPQISSKKFAFKLFDTKIAGYNLSDLIYSFLGFTGPVSIFIQHFPKDTKREVILGMFLNSNFKECYEKFCGDDLSNIFFITPRIIKYNCNGDNKNNILYIQSKSQKFSSKRPGIGMGNRNGEIRFWLDSQELFSKSYFNKYDEVFEEGSPFKEMKEILNIGNIEVFGFGDEDTLNDLIKKQDRDKALSDKMKKVDKSAFVNNEFDKEMFFSKTFAHRNDVDERANSKKES